MFRRFFTLLVLCSFGPFVIAQQADFEEGWVQLVNGQEQTLRLSYNSLTDVLSVKNKAGEEGAYTAEQVLNFTYQGNEYLSMPFNGGYSFFRVLHEGYNFAVLQKSVSISLLEYFVSTTKGAVQICGDGVDSVNMVLCEREIGPGFGMPNYGETSVQYKVQDAIFLAVGEQVHLVSCKYDTEGQLFATVPSMHKKNKRLLRRLKQVVQNEQQMQTLKKYAAAASADLEDPQQLIMALKTIYN